MTVETDDKRKKRGEEKFSRIPIKIIPTEPKDKKRLPSWIRIKAPTTSTVAKIKELLRDHSLHTVCEEASCPNLSECFSNGTATFMIMGDLCTRRCTFCDVAHGRPNSLDANEPMHLAQATSKMQLRYVVITSVNRDDLPDGGAQHFANCIEKTRELCQGIKIEILVPDFRGKLQIAFENLSPYLPDVFNHNLETVPRIYKKVRPGSDYQWSLKVLKEFKDKFPHIPTKSGLMVGVGETMDEVVEVLKDLKAHNCEMLTIGQYLQPSKFHLPVEQYITPAEFENLGNIAKDLGFSNVASGPLVRSSYHADLQASGKPVG